MVLSVSHIQKSFLEVPIIKDATFHIEAGEKVALTGINGAGKSTLFKIITGDEPADSGEIFLRKEETLSYLPQVSHIQSDKSIFQEVLSAKENVFQIEKEILELQASMEEATEDLLASYSTRLSRLQDTFEKEQGYQIKSRITGILKGLGFEEKDFHTPISTLSGGEKTRVLLGKILLAEPSVILLDEPTNHLDLNALAWLENYISGIKSAVFIISHDRYFLDRIVTKVIDLDNGTTRVYNGNYTFFSQRKNQIWKEQLLAYQNQQKEIKHQEEVISTLKSYSQEKFYKRAQSREKALSKIELLEKPTFIKDRMNLTFAPPYPSGNDVLAIEDLEKSFDGKLLFEHANMEIKKGEHIGIIGNNGTGKTTLLKILNGLESPDAGKITFGTNVHIAYYDQEQQLLSEEKTCFDEIQDDHPLMNNTAVRNHLAAFLFTGEDVFKSVFSLSGGERARLSLAKLILTKGNFIILDEPTNHLDMVSREILSNALNAYEGTLLYVSHDRYFIQETASKIIELYENTFLVYDGDYEYYLEKRNLFHERFIKPAAGAPAPSLPSKEKLDWESQKKEQAALRKKENDLKKLENRITELENQLADIDAEFLRPEYASNASKLSELSSKQAELKESLEILYNKWEELY